MKNHKEKNQENPTQTLQNRQNITKKKMGPYSEKKNKKTQRGKNKVIATMIGWPSSAALEARGASISQ